MQPECYLVYLEFSQAHRDSLFEVRELMKNHFPNYPIRTVIIDNANNLKNVEFKLDSHTDLISGNNNAMDISGVDVGIKWLLQRYQPHPKSVFYFANDTFRRASNAPVIRKFLPQLVNDGISQGGILGYTDRYPTPIKLLNLPVNYWIRSNFIVVPYAALHSILPFEIPISNTDLFSEDPKIFFKKNAPLSENYKRYLRTWLFGEKDPRKELTSIWHSAKPVTQKNFDAMKRKTRAIMSEHYISARITEKHSLISMNLDGNTHHVRNNRL